MTEILKRGDTAGVTEIPKREDTAGVTEKEAEFLIHSHRTNNWSCKDNSRSKISTGMQRCIME